MSRLGKTIVAVIASIVLAGLFDQAQPAMADGCDGWGSLDGANVTCPKPGHDVVAASNSGDGHRYTIKVQCTLSGSDETCHNPRVCTSNGDAGFVFDVFRDGALWSEACLTPSEAAAIGALSPAMVLEAFRRIHWPSAELVLQPPDHTTLVNLPTIFSTKLAPVAQSQVVTLLGLRVTIEALPVGYTWRAGDGSSWTTGDPGTAYSAGADVSALNTHTYEVADRVSASVDVTYHGRYQVDGGAWSDIPQELTVSGAAQSLRVKQASAFLTGQ